MTARDERAAAVAACLPKPIKDCRQMVYDTDKVKSDGCTEQIDKSGVSWIDVPGEGAVTVDAEHVISTSSKTLIYLGAKSEGIDIIVSQEGSVVTGRSDAGQDALAAASDDGSEDVPEDADDAHAGEKEPVTDGGSHIGHGDVIDHDNRLWRVVRMVEVDGVSAGEVADGYPAEDIPPGTMLSLEHRDGDRQSVRASEVTLAAVPDPDIIESDGKTVMTDGGRELDHNANAAKGAAMDIAAEVRKRPYEVSQESETTGCPHRQTDVELWCGGVCNETGEEFRIDVAGVASTPVDCPVCGAVGGKGEPDCDEQAEQDDEQVEQVEQVEQDGQSTLGSFCAGDNGGE